MKVFAIGATGFIGSNVVRLLAEWGHNVLVLHRNPTTADLPTNVRQIHGSSGRALFLSRNDSMIRSSTHTNAPCNLSISNSSPGARIRDGLELYSLSASRFHMLDVHQQKAIFYITRFSV